MLKRQWQQEAVSWTDKDSDTHAALATSISCFLRLYANSTEEAITHVKCSMQSARRRGCFMLLAGCMGSNFDPPVKVLSSGVLILATSEGLVARLEASSRSFLCQPIPTSRPCGRNVDEMSCPRAILKCEWVSVI
jgi:hypothetical protein